MLSNLGHVLMAVSDNVMVGHLNSVSLAAAGLATVAFNVLLLFGIGVSYAITPLVAEAKGKGDDESITQTLRHGLVINLTNGIILALVVVVGKRFLYHIGQPEAVVSLSLPYLSIITFSLIPALIYQSFKQFAEGLANTKAAMVVVLVCNVVNVMLNYILIYGHLGFPPLGLEGAGWATFSSRVVMALAMGLYVYFLPAYRQYRAAFALKNYRRELFKKMLGIGLPSGAQFIFEVAAFDFSLVMMGWLGIVTQAAHQIVINMASLTYMTTAGLAAAATVRVGYFMGADDLHNARRAAYTLLVMAIALMILFAVVFMVGNHWLPGLYVNDDEVIKVASMLLIVAGLFQVSDGAQVVCVAALRGLQDVKVPSVYIFISYWIIGLPLGYWLAFKQGQGGTGIWIGLLTGLTLTASAMFLRLKKLLAPRPSHAVIP